MRSIREGLELDPRIRGPEEIPDMGYINDVCGVGMMRHTIVFVQK